MRKQDNKEKEKKIFEFEILIRQDDENYAVKQIEFEAETEKQAWEILPDKIKEKYNALDWIYSGNFKIKRN